MTAPRVASMSAVTEGRLVALEKSMENVCKSVDRMVGQMDILIEAGLARRVTLLEDNEEAQDKQIQDVCDAQRDLAAEMRGALRILRWGGAIVAFFSLVLVVLANSHAIAGWIAHP